MYINITSGGQFMEVKEIHRQIWNKDINFSCPNCSYTFHIPFQTYINEGSLVLCPCCTKKIEIQHTGSIKEFISKILNEKAVL